MGITIENFRSILNISQEINELPILAEAPESTRSLKELSKKILNSYGYHHRKFQTSIINISQEINKLPILAEAPESTRSLTELSRKIPIDRNSRDDRDLKHLKR